MRGINVSGQKVIKMEDLRQYLALPSFSGIKTYIQSGNVLFRSAEAEAGIVRTMVEQRLLDKLGYPVAAIVRSMGDIERIIRNSPFLPAADEKKVRIYISFLSQAPGASQANLLESLSTEKERMRILGTEVFLDTDDYGGTKFSNAFIEKKLNVQGTVRNWNTLLKVHELLSAI